MPRRSPILFRVFALKHLRVDGVFAYTTDSFEKAFDLLRNRPEPVVKVMLKP